MLVVMVPQAHTDGADVVRPVIVYETAIKMLDYQKGGLNVTILFS